ncbi:hypothetical protein [Foetidibacter luteolus]|uniref:hypothetical protein n=1 Tax=Foetidibacter luteolus TaxID=2608880 RepID=UPI00129AF3FC|nr:hypothetical protein [Foetidibacter luteolus]
MFKFFTVAVLLCVNATIARGQDIELFKSGSAPNSSYVRQNNSAILADSATGNINYSDVQGSPYWNTEWKMALLVCAGNMEFMLPQAKLNLLNGTVHYISETGKEMVATNAVNRIVFFDGIDTSKPAVVFERFSFTDVSEKNSFYLALNTGNTRLLKLFTAKLESKLDPQVGSTVHRFQNKSSYFLCVNEVAKTLKKLNKENIFEYITATPALEEWLKKNKNSLKNEEQVTSFLQYYNSISTGAN